MTRTDPPAPSPAPGPAQRPARQPGSRDAPAAAGHGAAAAPSATQFASALIVDDHPLFCEALSLTLQAVAGIARIGTAHRLGDALELLAGTTAPDILVLDLDLPDVTGIEGLLRLRAVRPGLPVVVVSSITEPRVIRAALGAGAAGYIPKHAPREAFRAAFAALARGEIWAPEDLPEQAPGSDRTPELAQRLAALTPQQTRILLLIREGLMNKQIAFDLGIAETTVKAHVTAIMRKLGVQSRIQAVLIAQEADLSTRQAGD